MKRAIVLSGGGSKGAYEAGFLPVSYTHLYSFLVTIFISFIVLFKVSKPLNFLRKFNIGLNVLLTIGWSRVLRSGGPNHSKPLCVLVFFPIPSSRQNA